MHGKNIRKIRQILSIYNWVENLFIYQFQLLSCSWVYDLFIIRLTLNFIGHKVKYK